MKAQSNTTVLCLVLFKHWKISQILVANMMQYFGIHISQTTFADLRNTQYMWNTLGMMISFSKAPDSFFAEPRTWYCFLCCILSAFLLCGPWCWCGHWAQICMVPTIFIWHCYYSAKLLQVILQLWVCWSWCQKGEQNFPFERQHYLRTS